MTKILYTPEEVKKLQESGSGILIDVRDEEDYKGGHIAGAFNIPDVFYYLSKSTPEGCGNCSKNSRSIFPMSD